MEQHASGTCHGRFQGICRSQGSLQPRFVTFDLRQVGSAKRWYEREEGTNVLKDWTTAPRIGVLDEMAVVSFLTRRCDIISFRVVRYGPVPTCTSRKDDIRQIDSLCIGDAHRTSSLLGHDKSRGDASEPRADPLAIIGRRFCP